ncbi:hypothetical protein EJ04DRAFT_435231 [Polyplosphaeria fusca]|uniref:Uncharacterized protein n=1 Tax=Polyplosphaeria fusca TaxID=682080 RepID=A0A9P4V285_9PLEO|nr:hypothetical protein EJ04DRAFT_435231 [Polyplosphaeria fusca]
MLVVQGIVLGCALGLLMPLSTLALASHWNNLVPLVSMEATGFAFIGAAVYVTIAAVALQVPAWEAMCFASGGVTIGTLGAAAFLTNKCRGHARHSLQYSSKTLQFTQLPSLLFLAGYVAILFGVFSFPVYIVFLCTNSTGSAWPLQPSSMLIVSLACGVVSAPWSASKRIRDSVGPVNAFVIAATVGGVCFYNPGEMPFTTVSWPVSIIYGLCLGVLLTVHLKAISVFHWMSVPVPYHSDMAIRMAVVAAVGGIAAAGGILVTAILIEEGGFDLGMMVPGTSMLAGGVLVGAARYLRGYKQFFMAL